MPGRVKFKEEKKGSKCDEIIKRYMWQWLSEQYGN